MSSVTNDQLRRLLLNQSAPEERERLEEAILMEEDVAERLREQEFDLVDDYVNQRLNAADRGEMERNFLITPERVVTARVARALAARHPRSAADSKARKPLRVWRVNRLQAFATAAGLAAVVFMVHWGLNINSRGTAPPAGAGIQAKPTEPLVAPMQESTIFQSVTLLADANRGESKTVLHLGPGDSAIRLQLEVPEPKQGALYAVELGSVSRAHLFFASDLPVQSAGAYRFVEVTVPKDAFGPGARTITLRTRGSSMESPLVYRWQIESVQNGGAPKK
jgi:hypothetical protein